MNNNKTEEKIREILSSLECILAAHDSCAELVEVKDNRAEINCVGPCVHCDNKCIEEAIKEKLPNIEVILR
ncbi:MAG: hypothetical protein A2Y97_03160 [Nitrospirae bacterium RBG_13_39_12]|nr:MAG: hypothetical protein A2Y97_03160 [Nitrospirae bacterium RBG_13_39_12]